MVQQHLVCQGHLIFEVLRSH